MVAMVLKRAHLSPYFQSKEDLSITETTVMGQQEATVYAARAQALGDVGKRWRGKYLR